MKDPLPHTCQACQTPARALFASWIDPVKDPTAWLEAEIFVCQACVGKMLAGSSEDDT